MAQTDQRIEFTYTNAGDPTMISLLCNARLALSIQLSMLEKKMCNSNYYDFFLLQESSNFDRLQAYFYL
jgi:hypothetical protein